MVLGPLCIKVIINFGVEGNLTYKNPSVLSTHEKNENEILLSAQTVKMSNTGMKLTNYYSGMSN